MSIPIVISSSDSYDNEVVSFFKISLEEATPQTTT